MGDLSELNSINVTRVPGDLEIVSADRYWAEQRN